MKRLIALLMAVILIATTFYGCGQQSQNQPEEYRPTDVAQVPNETVHQTELPAEQPVIQNPAPLVISEVMPDNRLLTYGTELDWLELYNPSDETVELGGYYLTDDENGLRKMSLEGHRIGSGAHLVITLKDDAPFQLSEVGETVFLSTGTEIISSLTYTADGSGSSWDGQQRCQYPTPGYANTEEGYLEYLANADVPELSINEAISSNDSYPDANGVLFDIVEIRNNSSRKVELKGYYLTDGWEDKDRFYFPEISLEAGGYYLVYCSGDPDLGENHAPFRISSTGKTLYLARKGTFIDALEVPADLKRDESYGRAEGIPMYLDHPTFGLDNCAGYLRGVSAPEANLEPGMYAEPVTITLSGEGTVYYTLDGTEPTTRSSVYREPIIIDDVTTVRAISSDGTRTSAVSNFVYVVGKEHDLPVLVISMPRSSRNVMMRKTESSTEYPATMTLIEDGEVKFSVPFGMRLHGNDSRKGKKKNFQLRFRGEYGAGKLRYRLFEDRDIEEFDSLVLKGGSEDWSKAIMRDEVSTYMVNGTTALYTQAMKPVVLYLGDEYWGVHYIRERFSDEYVASHMDVSPESVNILFSSSGYVQVGSNQEFTQLKKFVEKNDMSKAENYQYLVDRIDVNGLMDWYICRSYLGDSDQANIRRIKSDEGDGLWHWAFFDLDWSFYTSSKNPIKKSLEDPNGDKILINGLLDSKMGQDAFLKRYAYLMSTILNEAYIDQCIDHVALQIESEMPRDRERWGKTMNSWRYYLQELYDFVEDGARDRVVLNDIQKYFHLSDEEMESYFSEQIKNLEREQE